MSKDSKCSCLPMVGVSMYKDSKCSCLVDLECSKIIKQVGSGEQDMGPDRDFFSYQTPKGNLSQLLGLLIVTK